MMVKLP